MNGDSRAELPGAAVTAPANLLLLGEYAVLEEGGLGVTMAVDRRVVTLISSSPKLQIEGRWGSEQARWPSMETGSLLASIVTAVEERSERTEVVPRDLPVRLEVDSRALFDSSGAKMGFGSSAAVTVAVSFSLLLAMELEGEHSMSNRPEGSLRVSDELLRRTFQTALAAHRRFQGGTGSGYDVAASVFGGIGRFRGGAEPKWEPMSPPPDWLPAPVLVRGTNPVATPGAVGRYLDWKRAQPRKARDFLDRSNECVGGFLAAGDWDAAKPWLRKARELGLSLGEEIGVPAAAAVPPPLREAPSKAVGAGNEIAIAFPEPSGASPRPLPAGCSEVVISLDGVRVDHE